MRRVRWALSCVAACSLFAGACGGSSARTTVRAQAPAVAQPPSLALSPVTVLDESYEPESLAVGTDATSVWYWGASPSGVRLFQWSDANRAIRSWDIDKAVTTHSGMSYSTLAVDSQFVWIGESDSLARFDIAAGTSTTFAVQGIQDNAAAEAHRPPEIRGAHQITAIAEDSSGNIAVALSASSTVKIFDSESKIWSDVQIPSGTDAWNVKYFADGTLAIALADYNASDLRELLLVKGSLTTLVHVDDASALESGSSDTLVVGSQIPEVVDSSGQLVSKVPVPAGTTLSARAGVIQTSDGWLFNTSNGLLEGSASGATLGAVPPSSDQCPVTISGGAGAPAPSGLEQCPNDATLTALGSDGRVWVVDRHASSTQGTQTRLSTVG